VGAHYAYEMCLYQAFQVCLLALVALSPDKILATPTGAMILNDVSDFKIVVPFYGGTIDKTLLVRRWHN